MKARAAWCTAGILVWLAAGVSTAAQHEHHASPPASGWAWSAESSVFLTGNFQVREFRDFHQVESQNWFMTTAIRAVGDGALFVDGMFSLEPFTLRDLGSSQAFQTGETFGGAPLIDYQHPHDLIMTLAAAYARERQATTLAIRGGLVDAPALGPTPFMHRASASLQPTAPLSHHQLDSTHITHGVVTGTARHGSWQVETSAFHGREPDEDRIALDLGPLDSVSVRGSFIRGGTRAQVSAGWINEPHATEPGDITRLTASVEYDGTWVGRRAALTLAWGQNRGQFSNEDALVAEATLGTGRRGTVYMRSELVEKHILEAGGLHPVGLEHPHELSTVAALLVGYQHRLWDAEGTLGSRHGLWVGADVTGHVTPANLREAYGRPVSVHLYARWTLRYPDRP